MGQGKENDRGTLERSHTRKAIRKGLRDGAQHSYLRDFIYGAIDGAVMTFAVVSGVVAFPIRSLQGPGAPWKSFVQRAEGR